MSQFPKNINQKLPQSLIGNFNPIKKATDGIVRRSEDNFSAQRLAEEESSYENLIFYPLDLAKSPEYKAYTLIQLFQPQTTDLQASSEEQSLLEAKSRLSSELEGLGLALGAGAVTSYVGGGIKGLIAAVGVGVVQQLSQETLESLQQNEENLAKLKNIQRLSSTRIDIGAKPIFGQVKYSIGLPMPKTIKTNYGFEYEDLDFKNINTMNTVAKMLRDLKNDPNKKLAGIKDYNEIAGFVRSTRAGMLDDVFRAIPGGANFEQYNDTKAGRVKAPISENIFKQVNKRSFDFSWEMIPKNRKELENIYKIIELLKINSHPKYINGDPYYLGIPGEFLIKFYIETKENEFLPKIARLCMKGIDVDYGSDSGMSFFRQEIIQQSVNFSDVRKGAPPTKITLSIKMEELEFLTADRILEGY